MAYKFRGTTLSFGGNVAKLRAARNNATGTQIDITSSDSTEIEFEVGFASREITFTVFGTPNIDVDDQDTASITWNTGAVRNLGNCIVVAVNEGGDVDGAITTDITLRKTSSGAE